MDLVGTLRAFHADRASSADVLRAVLGHPAWHVPLDAKGSIALADDDGERFLVAAPSASDDPAVALDGRALVRGLPHEADGVVFAPGTDHAVSFRRAELPVLLDWADALDLEDALVRPGPGQASRLHSAIWRVVVDADDEPVVVRRDGLLVVPLFTADDVVERWLEGEHLDGEIAAFEGPELFEILAEREDFDGLVFDPGFLDVPLAGPDLAEALGRGVDPRPGAGILPARSVAEIHLWLDLAGASREERKHVVERRPDGLAAVYEATFPMGRRRIAFAVTEPRPDPEDLGEGPSAVLCAGQLAVAVRAKLQSLPDEPVRLSPKNRGDAVAAARWLWELEKMLVGEAIPRAALRTPVGARTFRERPEVRTAAWIRRERARAEALAGTV